MPSEFEESSLSFPNQDENEKADEGAVDSTNTQAKTRKSDACVRLLTMSAGNNRSEETTRGHAYCDNEILHEMIADCDVMVVI